MSQQTLMSKRTGKPFRVLQATPSWMEEERPKEVTGTSLLWTLLSGPVLCDECGHVAHSKACEVERGDQFVEGQNGGAYMAQGPCGCTEVRER